MESKTAHYQEYFASQTEAASQSKNKFLVYSGLCAVGLVAIVLVLRSPPPVWGYVFVVIGLSFLSGAIGLHRALIIAAENTKHLHKIAESLGSDPTPSDIRELLRDLSSPDDNSNVPEALTGYLEGSGTSDETARAVARSAFGHAYSALSVASYTRTTLVLLGLFGTVLFFAFELTRPALLSGDLRILMPGLRGALACTLSGILGSVVLGVVSSRVESTLENLTMEAQAFIAGPFSAAVNDRRSRREVGSETELWEALRQEVADMADRTSGSVVQMANDIHAHTVALQEISEQFANLPQIKFPPKLADLATAIDDYKSSTQLLNATVTPLVEAVAAFGVFAPAKLLDDVQRLAASTADGNAQVLQGLNRVSSRTDATADDVHQLKDVLNQLPTLLAENQAKVDVQAASLAEMADTLRSSLERIAASTANDGGHAVGTGASLPAPLPPADDSNTSVSEVSREISNISALVQQIGGSVRELAAWKRRADRAPLMRLLLMPLRRGG